MADLAGYEPILATGVLAIARGLTPVATVLAAGALRAAGVRAFEVTLNTERALDTIAGLAEQAGPDDIIGAGTVLDVTAAREAIAAGAKLLVMPHVDEDVIRLALDRGIPVLPGAHTPTEIVRARACGAPVIKWFPACIGGPDGLAAIRGPLSDVPLVPTGGITVATVGPYIRAGAAALAFGGWLFSSGSPEEIESRGRLALDAVRSARTTVGASGS